MLGLSHVEIVSSCDRLKLRLSQVEMSRVEMSQVEMSQVEIVSS